MSRPVLLAAAVALALAALWWILNGTGSPPSVAFEPSGARASVSGTHNGGLAQSDLHATEVEVRRAVDVEELEGASPPPIGAGRVVLATSETDVPYTGKGSLCFTRARAGDLPKIWVAPVDRGVFELPALEVDEFCTIEQALLGDGDTAWPVKVLERIVLVASDTHTTVRLRRDLRFDVEVLDVDSGDSVADVKFVGSGPSGTEFTLDSTFDGRVHQVEVDRAVRVIDVRAPTYLARNISPPAMAGTRQSVVLDHRGRIEVELVGLREDQEYALLARGLLGMASGFVDLERGATHFSLDDLTTASSVVELFARDGNVIDRLDAAVVHFDEGVAQVELRADRERDLRPCWLHLKLKPHLPSGGPLTLTYSRFDSSFVSAFTSVEVSVPFDRDGGWCETTLELAPAVWLFSLESGEGQRRVLALRGGEHHTLEWVQSEPIDFDFTCIDTRTGEAFEPTALFALPTSSNDTSQPVRWSGALPTLHGQVAAGRYRGLSVGANSERGAVIVQCPIEIRAGAELEIRIDRAAAARTVVLTATLPSTPPRASTFYWGAGFEVRDVAGSTVPSSSSPITNVDGTLFAMVRLESLDDCLYLAPPVHHVLGPLLPVWIAVGEQGQGSVELQAWQP